MRWRGRMCNEPRRTVELTRISDAFAPMRIPPLFPDGTPDPGALENIRITDPTANARARRLSDLLAISESSRRRGHTAE